MSSVASPLPRTLTDASQPPTITLTSDGEPAYLVYNTPRRFLRDSKLFSYLSRKCPRDFPSGRVEYTLHEVMTALRNIITKEHLYDEENPMVVLCSQALDDALNVKALHVTEIREQVCKHFKSITLPPITSLTQPSHNSAALTTNLTSSDMLISQAQNNIECRSTVTGIPSRGIISNHQESAEPAVTTNGNNYLRSIGIPDSNSQALGLNGPIRNVPNYVPPRNTPLVMRASLPNANSAPVTLPSWAKPTAIAVVTRIDPNVPFNIDANYWVKKAFLKVLRQVQGVNQTQLVFPYREITALLSKYIMNNKDRLFDIRNYRVALVENDILGEAFGVKAFARSQVTALMRAQLILYEGSEDPTRIHEKPEDNVQVNTLPNPQAATGSVVSAAKDLSGATRTNHRSSFRRISITAIKEDSSDMESIYSCQGYETMVVFDSDTDTTDDDNVGSNRNTSQVDQEAEIDSDSSNVYRVEYEIDDGSNDSGEDEDDRSATSKAERNRRRHRDDSADDSDIEDVLIATAVRDLLKNGGDSDVDIDIWADSEASLDDSDDSDDFTLSNYDPEIQNGADVWKCLTCGQPNTPYMRFCHQCWEERKGWVPERVNPRRRKKEKQTKGIAVKRSQVANCANEKLEATASTSSASVAPTIGTNGDVTCINVQSNNQLGANGLAQLAESRVCSASSESIYSQSKNGILLEEMEITQKSSQNEDLFQRVDLGKEFLETKTSEDEILTSTGPSSYDSGFSSGNSQEDIPLEGSSQESFLPVEKMANELDTCSASTSSKDEEEEDVDQSRRKRQPSSGVASEAKKQRRGELPTTLIKAQSFPQASVLDFAYLHEDDEGMGSSGSSQPSLVGSSRGSGATATSANMMCNMCCVRVKDACFIHGQISHQVCCYRCAKMILKRKGPCPVCRRKIEKITRNIVV